MSTDGNSRSATFYDVLCLVQADNRLTHRQKQDLISALNTCARVLNVPLANLPTDPRQLGPRLAAAGPAAHGLSERSWANVRSLVSKAIAGTRPLLRRRHKQPLSPAWANLTQCLEPTYRRMAIATGLAWLTAEAIDPEHVTRDDLERFLEVARTENLRPKPEDYCRRFVNAWNQAVESVPQWPQVPLVWQGRRRCLNSSWFDFPSSLKVDVDAWLSRQGGDDLFDEHGPPTALQPITIKSHTGMILTSASGLVRGGVPPETIRSLADLVRLEHYKLILRDLWDRTGQKPSATLARRAELLISIGRHYVGLDQKALDSLRKAAQKLHPTQVGLTTKNRDRLRPFDDPKTFDKLVNLPFRMRAEVERGGLSPVRAAQRAEMAVAIAILLIAPIRIKNLRMIEIGRQLHLYGRRMMLSFHETEVKNAVSLEFEIDPATADLVRWFIDHHRPNIAPANSLYLFAGRSGPRTDCGLSSPLMRALHKGLGLPINPHLFRQLAAKLFLDTHPGQYETVRQLLGHKSIVTTMRFYAGFEIKAAAKLYRDVLTKRRGEAVVA